MTHLVEIGILLSVSILCLGIGSRLGPALAVRLARRETTRLITVVQALTEQLNRSTAQLNVTIEQRDDWERRAEENRKVIESIQRQRDDWCRLYDEQSIGHGNAQAIMMDAIEFLERNLKTAGVNVTLPAVIRETQALYIERHIAPHIERTGVQAVHRGSSLSPETPANGTGG